MALIRPASSPSRLALVAWTTWLVLLGIAWVMAWVQPSWHHACARMFQSLYGTPFATSPWYLRGNAPLHAFATMQATLCLVTGMGLLLPHRSPWWGVVGVVLIAFGDELTQRWSTVRGFDVRDWESDAAGLAVALIAWGIWSLWNRRKAAS